MLIPIYNIVLFYKYFLFPLFIVEHNMGVLDSFKSSNESTNGSKMTLWLLMIVLNLINTLGALMLGLGLFFTFPMTLVCYVYAYRQLYSPPKITDFIDPVLYAKAMSGSDEHGKTVYDGPAPAETPYERAIFHKNETETESTSERFEYDKDDFAPQRNIPPLEFAVSDFFRKGNEKFKHQDYYGAIKDFTQAIQLDKSRDDLYYARGTARIKTKDYLNAIDDFSKAIELNPNNAKAWFNRCSVKTMIGDANGSKEDLEEAVRLNPKLKKYIT